MAKRILVAGGAGFIGCNFVRYLLKERPGYDVVVVDKFSFSRRENLADVLDQIELIRGDITKDVDVKKAVHGCDYVVNFAAETHVDRSITQSGVFVLTEVYGTDRLLEMSVRENIDRYLQVSTDEVYGEIERGSFNPSDALLPRNPYSAAKAGADLLALAFHHTYKLPVVVTRCTNNYGPFQHVEKFIPKIITNALSNRDVPIYGTGSNVRDWIWVNDHCAGLDTVLHLGKVGSVYHVAGKQERTNIQVAESVLRILGKPQTLLKFVVDRLGHDLRYSLDIASTEALGWQPKMSFSEGLKRTVKWYVENDRWWRPLIK